MTHKLENKLPHINQLINIFFAVLFLNALSKAELNVLNLQINQIVVTLVLSYFILYTWWRHNDMYLSAVNRKFRFVVLGVFRIVLIILILNLQTVLYEQDLSAVFGFSILAILICITSIWQFSINFGPTYGKVRVLLKREIWTDALTLLAVAIVLFPLYFGVWPFSVVTGLTILVFLLLGIRPLARSLTHWKEATPPHRGQNTYGIFP